MPFPPHNYNFIIFCGGVKVELRFITIKEYLRNSNLHQHCVIYFKICIVFRITNLVNLCYLVPTFYIWKQ